MAVFRSTFLLFVGGLLVGPFILSKTNSENDLFSQSVHAGTHILPGMFGGIGPSSAQ